MRGLSFRKVMEDHSNQRRYIQNNLYPSHGVLMTKISLGGFCLEQLMAESRILHSFALVDKEIIVAQG